ncbi:MAG: hypothetical protein EPN30_01030 [Actinomycetota bacterium]|nr:MAG: hypothetical protein EPN30_01030 [Actinomycetota bacterium]
MAKVISGPETATRSNLEPFYGCEIEIIVRVAPSDALARALIRENHNRLLEEVIPQALYEIQFDVENTQ